MLVLSKLTNINHANGGSYDPPLFLYSALFPARGRFGGASPHGGGFGGFPRTAACFCGASPHSFLCRRGTFGLGRAVFRCFSHTRPAHGKSIRKILPVTLPYFILHRKIQEVC